MSLSHRALAAFDLTGCVGLCVLKDTDIGPEGCHAPFTGSYGHYAQDAATFKEWEVDYVKCECRRVDCSCFCFFSYLLLPLRRVPNLAHVHFSVDGCDQPAGHTSQELTCNMSQALLDTGRDFWFNFHCWHNEACAECGTSFRVGPDHHDNWGSTSGIINLLKTRQSFWGPDPTYGWPDPDFIYTGGQGCENGRDPHDPGANETNPPGQRCPGQTETEYISEFSIWSIAGGEIIFSSDPRNMTEFQKKVWFNTEILAVYNDTSGFQHIKEVDDTSATFTFPDGDIHVSGNCSLTRRKSTAACTLGSSFGCNADKTMWTDGGCRGVFVCDGVEDVICADDGAGKHTCQCKPGIKPPPGPPPSHHHVSVIPQVWMRPTADGGAAVVMHNPHDKATASITVDFSTVPTRGWTATTALEVRDLWKHASVGSATGKYTATAVAPHGSMFFKLTKAA